MTEIKPLKRIVEGEVYVKDEGIVTLRDLFLMDNNEFVAKIDEKFIRVEYLKKILEQTEKDIADDKILTRLGVCKSIEERL